MVITMVTMLVNLSVVKKDTKEKGTAIKTEIAKSFA